MFQAKRESHGAQEELEEVEGEEDGSEVVEEKEEVEEREPVEEPEEVREALGAESPSSRIPKLRFLYISANFLMPTPTRRGPEQEMGVLFSGEGTVTKLERRVEPWWRDSHQRYLHWESL